MLGLLVAFFVGYRLLLRSPRDGVVLCLGLTLLVLSLLGPIVWAWYVTWGVVVIAPAAVGRLRMAVIAISTFWAFAGMTSVHSIYMRMIHTFFLTDLLLVAMLLAVAVMPLVLGDSGVRGRVRLPLTSGTRGNDDSAGPQGRAAACWPAPVLAPAPPDPRVDQSARSSAETTRCGRNRATSSPATPLRAPYSSARSAPM